MDTCVICGRPVCLDCAIPFRGRVLCREDAAGELGEPTPPPRPAERRPRRLELIAAALLGVAALATVPPWERFGSLTGVLSAWRAEPDAWPLVAAIAALVSGAVALWLSLRGGRSGLPGLTAWGIPALLAAVATARAILGAPDYVDHTVAPYLTLLGASGASILALTRLRRTPSRP